MEDRPKVMIVDDDPQNSQFIEEILSDDYELSIASTGEEALCKIDQTNPDIILLDVMMPGINGYEVCKEIRSKKNHSNVKIILVTARAMLEEKLKGYDAGADDYITKPFQYEELEAKVKVFCRLSNEEKKRNSAETQLRNSKENLEIVVKERTKELEKINTQLKNEIAERKKTRELMIQTEKMMSLGGLAAGMAHEINNPLGAILQGAQNLERRLSPDLKKNIQAAEKYGIDLNNLQAYLEERNIPEFLHGIKTSGQKAAKTVLDMLQFSRKSESKIVLTNLVDLIENALELAGKSYNLKKQYDFRSIERV